jgi:hypothetical protein
MIVLRMPGPARFSRLPRVFDPLNGAPKLAASADLGPAQNEIRTIALSGYLALSTKAEQPTEP